MKINHAEIYIEFHSLLANGTSVIQMARIGFELISSRFVGWNKYGMNVRFSENCVLICKLWLKLPKLIDDSIQLRSSEWQKLSIPESAVIVSWISKNTNFQQHFDFPLLLVFGVSLFEYLSRIKFWIDNKFNNKNIRHF